MGVLCLVCTPVLAQRGERMIAEQFTVSPGDTLEVRVADADLEVRPADGAEARIEVYLDGRSMPRARTYFEQQRFSVLREGNTISVTTDAPDWSFWNWEGWGWVRIHVLAHVPAGFHLELQTSDGNIRLGSFTGRVNVRTSDGDITVDRLDGPGISLRTSNGNIAAQALNAPAVVLQTSDGDITLNTASATTLSVRTSDGNITAEQLDGDLDLTTSDGDITLGTVRGGVIALSTSDGAVHTDRLEGRQIEVSSSDGDLTLGQVSGALRASTASGNIAVRLLQPAEYALRTSSGDIDITAPPDLQATLNLRAETLRIASRFRFRGDLDEEHATGNLNGGGPLLEARATDGTITLHPH